MFSFSIPNRSRRALQPNEPTTPGTLLSLSSDPDFTRLCVSFNGRRATPGATCQANFTQRRLPTTIKALRIPTWSRNHNPICGKMSPKNNYFQLFNMLCKFRAGDAVTGCSAAGRRLNYSLFVLCFRASQQGRSKQTL